MLDKKSLLAISLRLSILILGFFVFEAASADVINVDEQFSKQNIAQQTLYVEDPNRNLTYEDIKTLQEKLWQQAGNETIRFGFTQSVYWFKNTVKNNTTHTQKLLFEIDNPLTDALTLYIAKHAGDITIFESGDHFPFASRPIDHASFLFPFELAANEEVSLIYRVQNEDELSLIPALWSNDTFLEENPKLQSFKALFYGGMIIIIIYHSLLGLITRQRNYLYFVFFVSSATLYTAAEHGLAFQYLWPSWPKFANMSDPIFAYTTVFFGLLFTRCFLNLKESSRSWYLTMNTGLFICVLGATSMLFVQFQWSILIVITIAFLCQIIVLICSLQLALKSNTNAKLFAYAMSGFIVCGLVYLARIVRIIPHNILTDNAIIIGILLEVIIFSFALANLILQLEKEKAAAKSEAQTKGEFLAVMSHEIRTPMNGVLGMADLLHDTQLNKTQRHYVDVIQTSGRSLLNVINDVLDYSKIEAGKMDLDKEPFNLQEVIDNALSIFRSKAIEKRIDLFYEIDPDVPEMVIGDASRLRQIILNLINNAFKFTNRGHVLLIAKTDQDGRDLIRFEIKDSGIGITPEQQEKLFHTFSQASVKTSSQYGGSGLGLSICKNLCELMGGQIGVSSNIGEGSTFWFTAQLPYSSPTQTRKKYIDYLQGKRILIVDPNTAFCELMAQQCNNWGMNAKSCGTGNTALALLKHAREANNPFDLITLDICLPDMDGIELTESIVNSKLCSGEVILISSTSDLPTRDILNQLHINYALEKPALANTILYAFCDALGMVEQGPESSGTQQTFVSEDPKHILVAEDNPTNQLVIKGILRKLGYTCTVVTDGMQVLKKLNSSETFDAILMDCEMPELDGWQATEKIRNSNRPYSDIPIIALTAHAMPDTVKKCLNSGMDTHLSKPFKSDKLEEKISLVVTKKSAL